MKEAEILNNFQSGTRVKFRRKGDLLFETGTVDFIWNCCCELAVKVQTPDGGEMNLIPSIGDEIESLAQT